MKRKFNLTTPERRWKKVRQKAKRCGCSVNYKNGSFVITNSHGKKFYAESPHGAFRFAEAHGHND
ncbi:MAG TPA: hypothetical protein V6D26_01635 [Stenomitos sp.]